MLWPNSVLFCYLRGFDGFACHAINAKFRFGQYCSDPDLSQVQSDMMLEMNKRLEDTQHVRELEAVVNGGIWGRLEE